MDGNIFKEDPIIRAVTYTGRKMRDVDYHALLRRKYEYAASHPWLAVDPDPPERKP